MGYSTQLVTVVSCIARRYINAGLRDTERKRRTSVGRHTWTKGVLILAEDGKVHDMANRRHAEPGMGGKDGTESTIFALYEN